jgi:hypothetical protein
MPQNEQESVQPSVNSTLIVFGESWRYALLTTSPEC